MKRYRINERSYETVPGSGWVKAKDVEDLHTEVIELLQKVIETLKNSLSDEGKTNNIRDTDTKNME